ncbi:MAG: DUF3575 domain-containing protein [Planctomycetota bacterium]|nr:MAG: DUF3575 domain-containing protein [Planctomycetota bacterium]
MSFAPRLLPALFMVGLATASPTLAQDDWNLYVGVGISDDVDGELTVNPNNGNANSLGTRPMDFSGITLGMEWAASNRVSITGEIQGWTWENSRSNQEMQAALFSLGFRWWIFDFGNLETYAGMRLHSGIGESEAPQLGGRKNKDVDTGFGWGWGAGVGLRYWIDSQFNLNASIYYDDLAFTTDSERAGIDTVDEDFEGTTLFLGLGFAF